MKKIFILLLVFCLLLAGCAKEEEFTDYTDTSALKEYYMDNVISDWRVLAALYLEDAPMIDYHIDFSYGDSLYSQANAALMRAVTAKLAGWDNIDVDYLTPLAEAVAQPYELATYDLCLSLMALYAWDVTPEVLTPAMKHLQEIQLSDGGYAADADSAVSDPYVSAMVLNVITAYGDSYKDSDSRDGLLTYLGGSIENDNTVAGNSEDTAAVLSALIYAGIPLDGEISTALCKAIFEFKTENGFAEQKDGQISETATAEVFLTFATARRASIFELFR